MLPKLFIQSRVTILSILDVFIRFKQIKLHFAQTAVLGPPLSAEKNIMNQSISTPGNSHLKQNVALFALFILCPPVALFRIWKSGKNIFLKIISGLVGLPLFIVLYSFFGMVLFASFLPPLDLTVGDRKDRTIVNSEGNYSATFRKTALETRNVYELIEVE